MTWWWLRGSDFESGKKFKSSSVPSSCSFYLRGIVRLKSAATIRHCFVVLYLCNVLCKDEEWSCMKLSKQWFFSFLLVSSLQCWFCPCCLLPLSHAFPSTRPLPRPLLRSMEAVKSGRGCAVKTRPFWSLNEESLLDRDQFSPDWILRLMLELSIFCTDNLRKILGSERLLVEEMVANRDHFHQEMWSRSRPLFWFGLTASRPTFIWKFGRDRDHFSRPPQKSDKISDHPQIFKKFGR